MSFEAGDVVICVNADINPACQPNPPAIQRLKRGALYRVAKYLPVSLGCTYWGGQPMAGLQLVGIDHAPGDGWQAWRFRKVVPADRAFVRRIEGRVIEPV